MDYFEREQANPTRETIAYGEDLNPYPLYHSTENNSSNPPLDHINIKDMARAMVDFAFLDHALTNDDDLNRIKDMKDEEARERLVLYMQVYLDSDQFIVSREKKCSALLCIKNRYEGVLPEVDALVARDNPYYLLAEKLVDYCNYKVLSGSIFKSEELAQRISKINHERYDLRVRFVKAVRQVLGSIDDLNIRNKTEEYIIKEYQDYLFSLSDLKFI